MEQLEVRLQFLEQENARLNATLKRQGFLLKLAAIPLVLLLTVAMLGVWRGGSVYAQGAAPPAKDAPIRTNRLAITDAGGKEWIVLEAPGAGAPEVNPQAHISILDEDGAPTASLVQFKNGCGFWADRFGTDKSFITLMSYGGTFPHSATLSMSDGGGGNVPLNLGVQGSEVYFSGRSPRTGKLRFSLETSKGVSALKLFDKHEDPKFLMTFDDKEAPVFRVQDEAIKNLTQSAVKSPVVEIKAKQHNLGPAPAK